MSEPTPQEVTDKFNQRNRVGSLVAIKLDDEGSQVRYARTTEAARLDGETPSVKVWWKKI